MSAAEYPPTLQGLADEVRAVKEAVAALATEVEAEREAWRQRFQREREQRILIDTLIFCVLVILLFAWHP